MASDWSKAELGQMLAGGKLEFATAAETDGDGTVARGDPGFSGSGGLNFV